MVPIPACSPDRVFDWPPAFVNPAVISIAKPQSPDWSPNW
jgi:hypothetical protein